MGRFLLGSTVVLLFPGSVLRFNPVWAPGGAVRMGEAMAQRARDAFYSGRRPSANITSSTAGGRPSAPNQRMYSSFSALLL